MNDLIEKVKGMFFGKEGEKKPPAIVFVGIAGVIGLVVYNNFFKKEGEAKVDSVATTGFQDNKRLDSLMAEEHYQSIKKKELEKDETLREKGTEGTQKQDSGKQPQEEQKPQAQQVVAIPPPPQTYTYGTLGESISRQELAREKKALEEERKMREEEERKKMEMLRKKVALSYIGYSINYPDEARESKEIKGETRLEANDTKGKNINEAENYLITTKGTLLDDIKLRVGANKTVRIKLESGDILVVKAIATNTGIVFDNKGILNGQQVQVQVEDEEGNMELVSYVIDNSNRRITKTAFLSFVRGFADGMVRRTQQTSALGTTTEFIQSGIQTGIGRGVAGATESLIQENQKNIIPDIMVLLSGERLKVMVIKTAGIGG